MEPEYYPWTGKVALYDKTDRSWRDSMPISKDISAAQHIDILKMARMSYSVEEISYLEEQRKKE